MNVASTALPSGLTVVSERLPGARTVALGAWVRCGTRYESAADNGVSHFLEHMVFKGSATRDALALARALETLGGQTDAYTTHELTCFSLHVLPEHVPQAVELLAELVVHAELAADAVETEKQVVVEEILESEDSPSDVVQELCASQVWRGHTLGLPVLGTADNVNALTAAGLREFRDRHYTADRILLAASGAVDAQCLSDQAAAAFARVPLPCEPLHSEPPTFVPGLATARLEQDQVHLCLAAPGLSASDPDRHALWAIDMMLGSTMSSRLFQEVREQRGLAYQVGSAWQAQSDSGLLLIDAIASPGKVEELLTVVRAETDSLAADGLSEEDLAWVKAYARTTISLGAESTSSQMARLARCYFYDGRYISLDETLAAVDGLTADDIGRVARRLLGAGQWVLAAVGPVTERRAQRWWKAVNG